MKKLLFAVLMLLVGSAYAYPIPNWSFPKQYMGKSIEVLDWDANSVVVRDDGTHVTIKTQYKNFLDNPDTNQLGNPVDSEIDEIIINCQSHIVKVSLVYYLFHEKVVYTQQGSLDDNYEFTPNSPFDTLCVYLPKHNY